MNTESKKEKQNAPASSEKCSMCKYGSDATWNNFDACYNCVGIGTGFCPNEEIERLMLMNGWKNTVEKATRIVLGFPGVGKTYIKEKYKGTTFKVLDSDSSGFDKTNFPNNYIEYIKSNIGKFDLILISTHEAVRKAVAKSDIMNRAIVAICYPAKELKDVWIRRLANRGNSEEFLSLIEQNYDKWIEDIERETVFYKEKLNTENSYLGSYLYRIGL